MNLKAMIGIIPVLIALFACEKDDRPESEQSYKEYLSGKAIISINIQGDSIWIFSSKRCDTCYVAPYQSNLPTIEQLSLIYGDTYKYIEPVEYQNGPISDGRGNVYISSHNFLYQIKEFNNPEIVFSTGNFNFNSFVFDQNNNVWFYGYNGIAFWDKNEFTVYNKDNSELPSDIIHRLIVDQKGIVWVCLDFKGLLKIDSGIWTIIPNTEIPGMKESSYLSFAAADIENNIWFNIFSPASNTDILRLNNGNWNFEYPDTGKYSRLVLDSQGTIWVIINNFQNGEFVNSSLKFYKNNNWIDFGVSDVTSQILIVNANDKMVYIGTMNGLIEKSR